MQLGYQNRVDEVLLNVGYRKYVMILGGTVNAGLPLEVFLVRNGCSFYSFAVHLSPLPVNFFPLEWTLLVVATKTRLYLCWGNSYKNFVDLTVCDCDKMSQILCSISFSLQLIN